MTVLAAVHWPTLAAFAGAMLTATLFVLAASGHFPAEHRSGEMRSGLGRLVLWGSAAVIAAAATVALAWAFRLQPWPAVVIAAGASVLAAPLLLQRFSDGFVDGRGALVACAAVAAALAALQVAIA